MGRLMTALVIVSVGMALMMGNAVSNSRTDDPLGIAVSPQTMLLSMSQGSVSVHTAIPYGSVDLSTLQLNGVGLYYAKKDSLGNLVAKFREAQVEAVVTPPSEVMTLTGLYKDGKKFSGSDTVRVRP